MNRYSRMMGLHGCKREGPGQAHHLSTGPTLHSVRGMMRGLGRSIVVAALAAAGVAVGRAASDGSPGSRASRVPSGAASTPGRLCHPLRVDRCRTALGSPPGADARQKAARARPGPRASRPARPVAGLRELERRARRQTGAGSRRAGLPTLTRPGRRSRRPKCPRHREESSSPSSPSSPRVLVTGSAWPPPPRPIRNTSSHASSTSQDRDPHRAERFRQVEHGGSGDRPRVSPGSSGSSHHRHEGRRARPRPARTEPTALPDPRHRWSASPRAGVRHRSADRPHRHDRPAGRQGRAQLDVDEHRRIGRCGRWIRRELVDGRGNGAVRAGVGKHRHPRPRTRTSATP